MAKTKVTKPVKAIGLARQANPKGTTAQQRALADQILRLNNQQRGQAFDIGETVRLGAGNRISTQGMYDDVKLGSPANADPMGQVFTDTATPAGVTGGIAEGTSGSSTAESAASQWTLENDPIYQQAMAGGQSAFNVARARALAEMQNTQTELAGAERDLSRSAASSRERLAGNYAARGMGGGAYGALTRAEAESNARQIAAQTSLKDQMAAVNQQYLENFGATGTDWTGTLVGQDYRNQAIQQAMSALLPRYTGV
jgi:hypothetical protein